MKLLLVMLTWISTTSFSADVNRRGFLAACAAVMMPSTVWSQPARLGLQDAGDQFEAFVSERFPTEAPALRRRFQDEMWKQIQTHAAGVTSDVAWFEIEPSFSIAQGEEQVHSRLRFKVELSPEYLRTERGRERKVTEVRLLDADEAEPFVIRSWPE